MGIKTLLTRIFACVGLGFAFIAILVGIFTNQPGFVSSSEILIFGGLFALAAFGLKLASTFSDEPRVNAQQMMMQQRMMQQTRANLGMNSGNYPNAAPMRPAMPPVNPGMAPGAYPNGAAPTRQATPASARPANPTMTTTTKPAAPTPAKQAASSPVKPAVPSQETPPQS